MGICAWIKLRILYEKNVTTVAMGTAHNIDFKRTICAQLFSITVRPITLKLSKVITDTYILNFTERNFDQLLVTLKIKLNFGKLSHFRQKCIKCVVSMVTDNFFSISVFKIQDIYVISNCTKFELNRAIRY